MKNLILKFLVTLLLFVFSNLYAGAKIDYGLKAYKRGNCMGCHKWHGDGGGGYGGAALSLRETGLDREQLITIIACGRPGTNMPFFDKKAYVDERCFGMKFSDFEGDDKNRPLNLNTNEVEIENSEKKIKKYIPLSKRQDKPDSALWLIRQHNLLKDSQIAKLVGITKNTVTSIRNKSYWNYNNLNPKDPVALNLFSQKDLLDAIEKAERRIKREKKQKEKEKLSNLASVWWIKFIDIKL